MKKTSTQEISELIRTEDGNDLEKAAAIAVVSTLLANRATTTKGSHSEWSSRSGLREGLAKNARKNLRDNSL